MQSRSTAVQSHSGNFIHCELPGLLQHFLPVLGPLLRVEHVRIRLLRGHLVGLAQQLLDALQDLVHGDGGPPVLILNHKGGLAGVLQ